MLPQPFVYQIFKTQFAKNFSAEEEVGGAFEGTRLGDKGIKFWDGEEFGLIPYR
jgi:hypothetical protein